jgi:hypothetical protein
MSVWFADPLLADPTARQLIDDVQVTPLNALSGPPWFGLDATVHVDPFHSSASVAVAAPGCRVPTAMQNVVERQDTPLRTSLVGWIDVLHNVPSH